MPVGRRFVQIAGICFVISTVTTLGLMFRIEAGPDDRRDRS
jgi:hypothetical protein